MNLLVSFISLSILSPELPRLGQVLAVASVFIEVCLGSKLGFVLVLLLSVTLCMSWVLSCGASFDSCSILLGLLLEIMIACSPSQLPVQKLYLCWPAIPFQQRLSTVLYSN